MAALSGAQTRDRSDIRRFWKRLLESRSGRWRGQSYDGASSGRNREKAYEITAELPELDEKDIEVKLANGSLIIKCEKREEAEEKKKDYCASAIHVARA
jgi:HSP20 family protein